MSSLKFEQNAFHGWIFFNQLKSLVSFRFKKGLESSCDILGYLIVRLKSIGAWGKRRVRQTSYDSEPSWLCSELEKYCIGVCRKCGGLTFGRWWCERIDEVKADSIQQYAIITSEAKYKSDFVLKGYIEHFG